MSKSDYFEQFAEFLTSDDFKEAGQAGFVRDAIWHLGFLLTEHGFTFSHHHGAYGNETATFKRGMFVIELWSEEQDLPLLLVRLELPVVDNPRLAISRTPKGGLDTVLAEIKPPYLVPTQNDLDISARIRTGKMKQKEHGPLRQERCERYGQFIRDYLDVLIKRYQALATP